jgi:hypothetical protein
MSAVPHVNPDSHTCKVVYELDEVEKQALLEGGRLTLTFIGKIVVPHRLSVQPV